MNKIKNISSGRLIMIEWKAKETKEDIDNNKLSYSKDAPLLVSYYPDLKKYLIMDGHHRAMELFNEGKRHFKCQIAEHQPKTYVINYETIILKNINKLLFVL